VGTPAASDLTLAPGAGHGDEGDASFQGPAQEESLSAQPKPTNANAPTNAEAATDEAGSVIAFAGRVAKPEAAGKAARGTGGLVMTRPKPEKRLNAKDRAKNRAKNRALAKRAKDKPEAAEEVAAAAPEVSGLSTAHPKPEKRKNAKERAKEKYAKKDTADGTTPTTAKAKSKVETKAEAKKAKKTKQSKAAA
jgi:hypothetical protein